MTTATMSPEPLRLSTKIYYGFGSVAYGIKDNGFAYFLLLFYNQVLGLPAGWVGAGIMMALIVDAVTDPLVGYASDNLHSRWGRRHPFMYASAIPVALAYFLLWNPPASLTQEALFAYFLVVAILVRVLITFYEIPSTALVAELTDDYDQRTSMLSFRYFFGWWGGLSISVLAYLVFLPMGGGQLFREGYRPYGIVASALILMAILVSAIGTHRHIPRLKRPPPKQPFEAARTLRELKETLSNRSFLVLFLSGLFTAMATGISTSLNLYFNTFFWEFTSEQIGLLILPLFASAALALVMGPVVSRRFGKKHAAIGVAGIAFVGAPMPMLLRLLDLFPENGTPALLYTMAAFNCVEVTLIIVASILISSMVADVVEDSEIHTGRRSEGVFFAARTFIQKAVHGVGAFAATMILAAIEFPRGAAPGEVEPTVIRNLALVYIPTLGIVYLIALGFLTGYRISRESHAANLERLAE